MELEYRSRTWSFVRLIPGSTHGVADSVLMHQLSSSVIVCASAAEGVKARVTRNASVSPNADGSNGISMKSSCCQETGDPFSYKDGSCLAPFEVVISDANANFDVSMVDAAMWFVFTRQQHIGLLNASIFMSSL